MELLNVFYVEYSGFEQISETDERKRKFGLHTNGGMTIYLV